ncbi:MAG: hypothetical protein HY709_09065, partial [Candidatus Latescibacteria bacterium]|nr:hypothetical protein [Candidatus Latescibacterota bacterium]
WTGLSKPDTIYFDPNEEVVYLAHLTQQVGIYTLDGDPIATWGEAKKSERPGEFLGCPHGIWMDSCGDLYVGEVLVDGRIQKFIRQ